MDYLQNYHVIKVTYLRPTNFNPSRVKLYSERFEQSKIIPYDHYFPNTLEIAQAYLISKGYLLTGKAQGKNCYYIISKTFKPFKDL